MTETSDTWTKAERDAEIGRVEQVMTEWEHADRYLWTDSRSLILAGRALLTACAADQQRIADLEAQVDAQKREMEVTEMGFQAVKASENLIASIADTLRAERDAAQQQIATLREALEEYTAVCECGHERVDHGEFLGGAFHMGCRQCVCEQFALSSSTRPQEQPSPSEQGAHQP